MAARSRIVSTSGASRCLDLVTGGFYGVAWLMVVVVNLVVNQLQSRADPDHTKMLRVRHPSVHNRILITLPAPADTASVVT